jgi:uncharacterized protein YjbJ (UPF0337 family)
LQRLADQICSHRLRAKSVHIGFERSLEFGAWNAPSRVIGRAPARGLVEIRWSFALERNLACIVYRTSKRAFQESFMSWDVIQGNWKQLVGNVKEQWGKLTDDEITQIDGKREQLEGKLQEKYGYGKDKAQTEVDDWIAKNK